MWNAWKASFTQSQLFVQATCTSIPCYMSNTKSFVQDIRKTSKCRSVMVGVGLKGAYRWSVVNVFQLSVQMAIHTSAPKAGGKQATSAGEWLGVGWAPLHLIFIPRLSKSIFIRNAARTKLVKFWIRQFPDWQGKWSQQRSACFFRAWVHMCHPYQTYGVTIKAQARNIFHLRHKISLGWIFQKKYST